MIMQRKLRLALCIAALAAAVEGAPTMSALPMPDGQHKGTAARTSGRSQQELVPREFDYLHLVLLRSGKRSGTIAEARFNELMIEHLKFLHVHWKEGALLTPMRLEGSPDREIRGMIFYRGDLDPEEVLSLARQDPLVQAGELEPEVVRVMLPKGRLLWQRPGGNPADGRQ